MLDKSKSFASATCIQSCSTEVVHVRDRWRQAQNCHSNRNHKIDQNREDRDHQTNRACAKARRHAWADDVFARYSTPGAKRDPTLSLATCWAASTPRLLGTRIKQRVFCTELLQLERRPSKASKAARASGRSAGTGRRTATIDQTCRRCKSMPKSSDEEIKGRIATIEKIAEGRNS